MNDHNFQPGDSCFVDTNIWLYSFIKSRDDEKHQTAKGIISGNNITISTQIINEMSVNLLSKAKFPEEKIQTLIESLYQRYTVLELSQDTLLKASKIRANHAFSFWDSIVAASALDSEADFLLSEDMQHGFVLDKRLLIINPFK